MFAWVVVVHNYFDDVVLLKDEGVGVRTIDIGFHSASAS